MTWTFKQIAAARLESGHARELEILIDVLDAHGWRRDLAAVGLECAESTLQGAIDRHPHLAGRMVDGRRKAAVEIVEKGS